MAEFY